jgi:hypothetical protein
VKLGLHSKEKDRLKAYENRKPEENIWTEEESYRRMTPSTPKSRA